MLNTKKKYLKYKQKYLNLKKMIGGGIDASYKKNDDILTLTYRIDDYNKEIKYRIIDKLGEGNYGIVHKIIKDGDTKNTFIFKEGIRNDYQSYKEGINSNLLKNILDDDMLVLFQGKYESDFLISTYNGNDLLKEFNKNKQQIKKKYANTTTQLLELLHTINKNNIFHNDIKLENITIKDDKVYLIDFGFLTQSKSNIGTFTSMSYNGVITLLTVYNFNAYYKVFPKLKTFLKDTDIVGFFYCCIDLLFLTETDDYSSFNILHSLNISTYKEDDIYRLFDLFYFILPESERYIMEEPDYSKYDSKLPYKDTAKSIFGNFPDENTNLFRFMAYIYYKIKLYLIKNQTQQIWYKDFLKIMSACFLPDFNYDEFKKDFENIVSQFSKLPDDITPYLDYCSCTGPVLGSDSSSIPVLGSDSSSIPVLGSDSSSGSDSSFGFGSGPNLGLGTSHRSHTI